MRFWTAKTFETYSGDLVGETDGLATKLKRRGRRRKSDEDEDRYPYLETIDGTPTVNPPALEIHTLIHPIIYVKLIPLLVSVRAEYHTWRV